MDVEGYICPISDVNPNASQHYVLLQFEVIVQQIDDEGEGDHRKIPGSLRWNDSGHRWSSDLGDNKMTIPHRSLASVALNLSPAGCERK